MNKIKEDISYKEIRVLLDDVNTREETLAQLKSLNPVHDEVKGLKILLEKYNWDFNVVLDFEAEQDRTFKAMEVRAKRSHTEWIRIVATFLVLLTIGAFINYQYNSPTELDRIYAKYHIRESGLPTVMSTRISSKHFDEAMGAFRDEEYNDAYQAFKILLKINKGNDTLNYFVGSSAMELNDFNNAIHYFEQVGEKSSFHDRAEYNRALSLLKRKKIEEAKVLFTKIAQTRDHFFKEEASNILLESLFTD